jgi:peptidoglycan-associated lipoprotein
MKFAVTQLQTPSTRSARALVFLSLGLAALAGCHHKTAPVNPASTAPPTPAPTANLTADPLAVDLGQSVVLNWRTTDATSVSIDGIGPVAVNGTQTVTPSTSTNFHLVAKGDGGTAEANVRVTVRVPTTPTTPTADNSGDGDASADKIFHQNVPDIFFDYDSYSLRADGQTAAQKAAGYLAAHPEIKIVIGGYCDERGSAEYNLALGENRANSAKTALVNDGVPASRIRVVSFGKEKQFCSDATEACYQQNRRAQFSLDR